MLEIGEVPRSLFVMSAMPKDSMAIPARKHISRLMEYGMTVFGSGGDTMFDMYSLAVTMWGIAIPLAVAGTYFLNWPVVVVYACTCVDEVGKIPWTLIHFKKYKWVKDLTR